MQNFEEKRNAKRADEMVEQSNAITRSQINSKSVVTEVTGVQIDDLEKDRRRLRKKNVEGS